MTQSIHCTTFADDLSGVSGAIAVFPYYSLNAVNNTEDRGCMFFIITNYSAN